jgi:flagellar hook assembly protein FlgD
MAPAGRVETVWDGRDDHGARLSAGVYFVRATAGGDTRLTRVVLR